MEHVSMAKETAETPKLPNTLFVEYDGGAAKGKVVLPAATVARGKKFELGKKFVTKA